MLFSAPLEVARTKACTVAPSSTSASVRCEPMKPSAPVDEHGASLVDVPELAAKVVERAACPEGVVRHGAYASASVSKRTESPGLGSLASAALTAVSTLVVSAFAAIVGVVIAREFGRTDETDGFFAAYGVFIVIVARGPGDPHRRASRARASARRSDAWPGDRRIRDSRSSVVAVPLLLVARARRGPLAALLTGNGSAVAQDACADALRWIVPAAVAYLFAGLAASGLAALDDYATAASRICVGQHGRARR